MTHIWTNEALNWLVTATRNQENAFLTEEVSSKAIPHYYTIEYGSLRRGSPCRSGTASPDIQVTPGFCKSSTDLQQSSHHSLGESLPMSVTHLGCVLVLPTIHFWLCGPGSVSKGWIQFLFLSSSPAHQYLQAQAWEEGTSTQQIKQLQNKRNPIQLFPASGLSNESDIRVLCVVFLQLCSFFLHY